MNGFGWTAVPPLTRRGFLQVAGASAATLALTQAVPRRAEAATWRLHEDTGMVGLHQLYSGGDNPPGCDTGEDAGCRGPGRMSCYWGALYVNSVTEHRLRTGPFTGSCAADWPGTGNAERVRWASHLSASVWAPEYRFLGKLYVYDIMARPGVRRLRQEAVAHDGRPGPCTRGRVRSGDRSMSRAMR